MAAKAVEAADTLMAWLQTQPRTAGDRFPDAAPPVADRVAAAGADAARAPLASADGELITAARPAGVAAASGAKRASPAPIDAPGVAVPPPAVAAAPMAAPAHGTTGHEHAAPLRLPHTDWLYHRLCVVGPAAELTDFCAAAAGAGTVPWHLDLDRMAEDVFHLLVAPPARAGSLAAPMRSLSLAGSRILADQLCAAVARRHALAVGRVGHSRACPFDLHALIPVSEPVLRCGPDDPAALAWLWTHWGTTQSLHHAEAMATDPATRKQLKPGEAAWTVAFWSADWTPWPALTHITARWPALRFAMRPLYDTP